MNKKKLQSLIDLQKIKFIFALYIVINIVAIYATDNEILKLATLEWPPYVGKNLKLNGFTTEIVTTIFKNNSYTTEIQFMPWARVLSNIEKGINKAGYPAYYSIERAKKYEMSDEIADGPLLLLKKKSLKVSFEKLEDLKDFNIGVVRGYVNSEDFDKSSFIKKIPRNKDEQNISAILKGRIDMCVIDKYVALHLLNKKFTPQEKALLNFVEKPLQKKPLFVLFDKKNPNCKKMLEAFNNELKKLKISGKYNLILKKYNLK